MYLANNCHMQPVSVTRCTHPSTETLSTRLVFPNYIYSLKILIYYEGYNKK